jgi:hypothetical protein
MRTLNIGFIAIATFAVSAQAAPVVPTGTNPKTGQPWANGDSYRLIFITSAGTPATSTDIEFYNTFAQTAADNSTAYDIGAADGYTWKVVGSTAAMNAKTNTATDPTVHGVGEPILLLDGTTIVANDYADLWDHSVQNGVGLTETGAASTLPWPWTGSFWDGTAAAGGSAGNPMGVDQVAQGNSTSTANWVWRVWTMDPFANVLPVMALSNPLKIGGPSSPFRLTIKPNDPESRFQLAWDSQPGMLYTVRSSTSLSGPISGWTVVEGNIAATPPTNTKNVEPTETTLFYAVEENPAPPVTLLSETFETNDGGFTVVTAGGTPWAYGDPESPGSGDWVVTTGNAGSAKAWGTNLVGTYVAGTDTSLHSPVIDLTGAVAATLSFARAIDAPVGSDPKHTLEVNVIDLATNAKTSVIAPFEDPDANASPWKTISVAIPAEALGKPVYLEWRFIGNGSDDYLGAYIDDVTVTAVR